MPSLSINLTGDNELKAAGNRKIWRSEQKTDEEIDVALALYNHASDSCTEWGKAIRGNTVT